MKKEFITEKNIFDFVFNRHRLDTGKLRFIYSNFDTFKESIAYYNSLNIFLSEDRINPHHLPIEKFSKSEFGGKSFD